jgi:hypothetical protein
MSIFVGNLAVSQHYFIHLSKAACLNEKSFRQTNLSLNGD